MHYTQTTASDHSIFIPIRSPRSVALLAQEKGVVLNAMPVLEHPPWKRALDVTCIVLALPIVLTLMMGIALAIKLVSPGPIFFRQKRVGLRRVPFMCFKFRSMKVDADESVHQRDILHRISTNVPMAKMDGLGDSRLIPFGALLRASGLDELPQLINVWRGEMSLVGPRPCTTYELESYPAAYRVRFETLPGLTGLWQVSGKNRTTFSEMIDLDIRYVRTKSLLFDLNIMARTFGTVIEQIYVSLRGRSFVRTPA